MEAPKRIYLQVAKTEEDDDWDDEVGVTWCVDRINDTDAEYVRRDVAVKLRDTLEWLHNFAEFHGLDDIADARVRAALAETAWLADEGGEEGEA